MKSGTQDSLRVGILGCSAFALRAMVPALVAAPSTSLAACASRDLEKARDAAGRFGGRAHGSYEALLADPEVDAVYIPLPNALHTRWACLALDAGKHVLVEKPLACSLADARQMIERARGSGLVLLENFLFPRHSQFAWVKEQLASGAIGQLRFLRAAFSIPALPAGDIRYAPELGGGARLDVGTYMVKSARSFLGAGVGVTCATRELDPERGVDLRGSATFVDEAGVVAQTLWGFDTPYQCSWELIGSDGRIVCPRALTPPAGFRPSVVVERGRGREELELPADDHCHNQWEHFAKMVRDGDPLEPCLDEALAQATLLDAVDRLAAEAERSPKT